MTAGLKYFKHPYCDNENHIQVKSYGQNHTGAHNSKNR